MTEEKPKTVEQAPKSRRMVWIVVAVVVVVLAAVGGVEGYYYLQSKQQPSIQVTNVNFGTASTNPQSSTPVNQGRVSGSGSFSYTADAIGTYVMAFDNSFSVISSKSVAFSYSINGKSTSTTFTVPAGQAQYVTVNLNKGDTLSGQYSITGGSGNDVNFWITGSTCTANVPFSFVLVNSGSASGYVTVGIQSNGQTLWSNKYYISKGQQATESGSLSLPTCSTPQLTVVVLSQQKG
jgi:hypothetical protein